MIPIAWRSFWIIFLRRKPKSMRRISRPPATSRGTMGCTKFYDVDAGIAHLVLMEAGHVVPGDLIVGTDSHCTIYGSLGALGTGIGYTEVASVWITGKLWLKVPESIRIILDGRFPAGVYSKDLMLHLIGKLGADGCGYKSVEFYGGAVSDLSVSERMTMTNLAMEMGVKCAFFPPDEKTAEYLKGKLDDPSRYHPVLADDDAVYEQDIRGGSLATRTDGRVSARSRKYETHRRSGRDAYRSGLPGFLRQCEVRRPRRGGGNS